MAVSRETYESVMQKYGYACAVCKGRVNVEAHHRVANTKLNRKRYPNFIDSEHNLIPLCGNFGNGCHEKKKHLFKISDKDAERFEEILRKTNGKDM